MLILGKRQSIFLGVVSLLAHYLCIVVDFISNYEIIKVKFSNIELLLLTLFISFLRSGKRLLGTPLLYYTGYQFENFHYEYLGN